jgi:hypothetical protein
MAVSMSTEAAPRRPPVKRRDVAKYVFASCLALITMAGIAGMTYARYERQRRDAAEAQRIQQTLNSFGQDGRIPEKLPQPKDQPAVGGNS